MKGKKDIFHWIHVLFGLYMMFGGFLPYVQVYAWISLVVTLSWIVFGKCILNDGYDYNKGSLMEDFFGDGGLELFVNVFAVGQIVAAARLRTVKFLIVFALHELKFMNRYESYMI